MLTVLTPSAPQRPAGSPIRVVIADDHAIVRDGLRTLIESHADLTVVGEAANGDEAWQRARDLAPDVLVLDLSMPGTAGLEAAIRVAHDCPRVRVVALTMHEERGYVTQMLRAGVAAYVLKRTASAELVQAIRTVAGGGSYVDPSLAGDLLTDSRAGSRSPESELPADLSAREREVIRYVALGYTNKEIAAALELSVKTVETHKANAMAKLGFRSRAALVRFAIQQNWLNR